jgi:polysaccharide export outer membrane protein
VLIALAVTAGTFAQSPNNAQRQRRASSDGTQQAADTKTAAANDTKTAASNDAKTAAADDTKTAAANDTKTAAGNDTKTAAADDTKTAASNDAKTTAADDTKTAAANDKTSGSGPDKDKTKPPEVTPDGKTNRADPDSEAQAIVPYYNNFFTNYRLGPDDIISVNVFQQEKYSKQGIKIPPSGRVYLALIPDGLFVNGKTPDQVADLIKKRYDEYIIDPQVSVSLDQAGSYRYSVVGDVAVPGIKLMSRRLSVSEAVAEAGGVLQTGNRSKIFVLRKQQDGTLKPIPVNLTAVYKGQAPDSVYLVPGDQVIVPGNKLKKLQTILGFAQVMTFANMFRGGW